MTTVQNLDKIIDRMSEEAFLSNKGLSNEVGIHVFCYPPQDEIIVRKFFVDLQKRSDVPFRIIERDLYKIFLEICEERRILTRISDMEERRGKEYLESQLQKR